MVTANPGTTLPCSTFMGLPGAFLRAVASGWRRARPAPLLCGWVLLATGCGGGQTPANDPAPTPVAEESRSTATRIEVATVGEGSVIRSDIGRATFGSGVAFDTAQLRWTMDRVDDPANPAPPVSSATRDAMKGLGLGTLRFPNGDSSFAYISEDPQASYPMLPAVTMWNRYLTPDDVIRYTAPGQLDMERLFEVNTVFWLQKSATWDLRYLNDEAFTRSGAAPRLNAGHLAVAARRAADWVRRDNGQTLLWEVGNEDWARWNAAQHADIFHTFQNEMKAVRPGIRLLAQGLGSEYNGNTPEAWFGALRDKLAANGKLDSVYAYSVHQYVHGGHYPDEAPAARRSKQTQDMLAAVAEGRPAERVKGLLASDPGTRAWKLWMTEFNVHQRTGRQDSEGRDTFEPVQDMGHALVIADWTGRMLEQNVERMFMHSLDHHPSFALVQYANLGATIETPRVTVPGHAFSMYARAFGKTLLRNRIASNPTLTAPNGKTYPQLAVYSSLSADGASLRLMVINRHLTQGTRIDIDTQAAAGRRRLADGEFRFRQLRADQLTQTNAAAETVTWSREVAHPQTAAEGIRNFPVAAASVNLFVVPLQSP